MKTDLFPAISYSVITSDVIKSFDCTNSVLYLA